VSQFMNKVETLRWDDHRYYHQSRVNQTLHLISAVSFLVAYAMLFIDPAVAGLVGWLVGMVTRQSGHIFFEPRGYDHINGATDEYKESIKVGYNMRRKAILIGVWLSVPALLLLSPNLFGLIQPGVGFKRFVHDVGHENPHGSVPQHPDLLAISLDADLRRAVRSDRAAALTARPLAPAV
jgi:hypothetical protein